MNIKRLLEILNPIAEADPDLLIHIGYWDSNEENVLVAPMALVLASADSEGTAEVIFVVGENAE